jgi:hypothetical protein
MIYMIDIDNTICTDTNGDYENAQPFEDRIKLINDLFMQGHTILYWTARGSNSGLDWRELTKKQLDNWGCLHNGFSLGKPHYDVWVDDKANWIFE